MKHLSIRFRITFWFTAALIVVVLFTYFVVFSVSNQIIQKTIRDNLIETVENNVDEVEFYSNIDDVDLNNDVDHFVVCVYLCHVVAPPYGHLAGSPRCRQGYACTNFDRLYYYSELCRFVKRNFLSSPPGRGKILRWDKNTP